MARRQGVGWKPCLLAGACTLAIVALVAGGGSPLSSVADEPAVAAPCSKAVAKQGLRDFVKAYNRGNFEKLDRLFTQDPEFMAYTAGPPGSRSGLYQRSTLIRYFENRHRKRDRFHLRQFGRIFEGHGGADFERSTHFSLHVARRADGFNRGRWFRIGGKGALVCDETGPRIFLLNFGSPPWMTRG